MLHYNLRHTSHGSNTSELWLCFRSSWSQSIGTAHDGSGAAQSYIHCLHLLLGHALPPVRPTLPRCVNYPVRSLWYILIHLCIPPMSARVLTYTYHIPCGLYSVCSVPCCVAVLNIQGRFAQQWDPDVLPPDDTVQEPVPHYVWLESVQRLRALGAFVQGEFHSVGQQRMANAVHGHAETLL